MTWCVNVVCSPPAEQSPCEATSPFPRTQVRLLLDAGADAAATSLKGLTVLHVASAAGHPGLLGPLIAAGADANAPDSSAYGDCDGGRTPLMYACHFGSPEAVKALLAAGADPRALSACGWPPLFYAVEARCAFLCAAHNLQHAAIAMHSPCRLTLLLCLPRTGFVPPGWSLQQALARAPGDRAQPVPANHPPTHRTG